MKNYQKFLLKVCLVCTTSFIGFCNTTVNAQTDEDKSINKGGLISKLTYDKSIAEEHITVYYCALKNDTTSGGKAAYLQFVNLYFQAKRAYDQVLSQIAIDIEQSNKLKIYKRLYAYYKDNNSSKEGIEDYLSRLSIAEKRINDFVSFTGEDQTTAFALPAALTIAEITGLFTLGSGLIEK